FDIAERAGATEFTGYTADEGEGEVIALVRDGAHITTANAGDAVTIITNQTPFYGESGGQMGDAGTITGAGGLRATVRDTGKPLGRLHAHHSVIDAGSISVGAPIRLAVDSARRDRLRANHSATHLLHAALRQHLGPQVTQKGSMVGEDRLRFDFSHPTALSPQDIAVIETAVNAQVRGNGGVTTRLMTPDDAIAAGAMALFGEKYGDEVRVLSMGAAGPVDYSVELCGGTHVTALGDIGLIKVIGESAVSSGVRRLEALTGEAARQYLTERDDALKAAAAALRTTPDDVPARVAAMADTLRKMERELADAKKALALGGGQGGNAGPAVETINGVGFLAQIVDGLDPKGLRGAVDDMKQRLGSGVAVLVAVNDGRASIAVGVTADAAGQADAVALVKAGVAALGGQGGGGRADMAQGGGPNGDAAQSAVDAVKAILAA
ncbi:MAG: DHHA1 domain-containing protein, partial [Sphingopyxis sp.]